MPSTVLPLIRSYVLGVGFIPVALTNSLSAAGAMRMDKVPGFQNSYFFAKTLIFCAFPQKNSYQSVGAIRPAGRFDQHLPQHDWPVPRKCGNSKSNFEIPHIADIKQKFSRYCELCRKRIKVLNRGILLLWI